ncbi:MAG: carboxyltransferase domain-containing protein [Pyrinomonadaceae bacterium]|nr:carboxyltransferase domain-containing protein [Pyrinomonadaceae bacterium]
MSKPRFFPLGENALTMSFGNVISVEINERILNLARFINEDKPRFIIDVIPAYSSLTIIYSVLEVKKTCPNFSLAFDAIKNFVENKLQILDEKTSKIEQQIIEIPANFDKDSALDLDFIANEKNLSPEEIIEIFTSKIYQVFMLGFLPAFAYMGEVDERIATPRKQTPRKIVPKGSIGIKSRKINLFTSRRFSKVL